MSDQPERKQVNFTIVPDEQPGEPRIYANFCSIAHTPFDFTLTFCEVMPLSEKADRGRAGTSGQGPRPGTRRRSGPVRPESHRRAAGSHARLLRDLLERRLVEGRAHSLVQN